jgi:hypothetical protein
MTISSLATLLAVTVYFDLPNRREPLPEAPLPEKLTLQAPPLVIQARPQSDEDTATRFMEAVALSHVAPLLPQTEVDRAAEPPPPPAVQVYARAPTHNHAKPAPANAVAAVVPLPPTRAATPPPQPSPRVGEARPFDPPLPVGPAPAARPQPQERRASRFQTVGDFAEKTKDSVVDGLESVGRSLQSLLPKR